MHSSFQTHENLIRLTKAQCFHSGVDDTLEVEIPQYGNIRQIRVKVHLVGGLGKATFQPVGHSEPNSDCSGNKFTPPTNRENKITFLSYESALADKRMWETEEIRQAVVTYRIQ